MFVVSQTGHRCELRDEIKREIQLRQALAALEVLHTLDAVQRQIQILQLFEPAHVLCQNGMGVLILNASFQRSL